MEVGGLRVPHPKEEICGDDFAFMRLGDGRCLVLLVDGLGHGIGAAEAAEAATRLFRSRPGKDPEAILAMLHDGLRGTRGAAAAIAEIDPQRRVVRFAGVGNISATVHGDGVPRSMVSHHGTLGHRAPRFHEFTYPSPERAVVVMHSDGMSARWNLGAYPGLAARHPMLIAGVLYRDFRRPNDDAAVVVLREARP
jgi:hypothetical protein